MCNNSQGHYVDGRDTLRNFSDSPDLSTRSGVQESLYPQPVSEEPEQEEWSLAHQRKLK